MVNAVNVKQSIIYALTPKTKHFTYRIPFHLLTKEALAWILQVKSNTANPLTSTSTTCSNHLQHFPRQKQRRPGQNTCNAETMLEIRAAADARRLQKSNNSDPKDPSSYSDLNFVQYYITKCIYSS